MDEKSKKSSIASGSLYMSANEFELKDMTSARLTSDPDSDSLKGLTSINKDENQSHFDAQSSRLGDLNSVDERRESAKSEDQSIAKPSSITNNMASNEEDESSALLVKTTNLESPQTSEAIELRTVPAPSNDLPDELAERSSLLVKETNLDGVLIEGEQEIPELPKSTSRFTKGFIIGVFLFVCGVVLGIILLIILIPMCFHTLQYDEVKK